MLSKLRLAANHPFLVIHKKLTKDNPGTYVCGLCNDPCEDPISSRCKHVFCREDIKQFIESFGEQEQRPQCPVCFTPLTIDLSQETLEIPTYETPNEKHNYGVVNRMLNQHSRSWTSSTKIEALLQELELMKQTNRTTKSIVFSQFVSFLDLIQWRLLKAGYHCVKLDGRMTPQQRNSVITTFMTVSQVTVFLVSLKAGGVALNLTEASRVFILDPWWNVILFLFTLARCRRTSNGQNS